MTIGEDIREKAQSVAVTNADWFANQLSSELSQSAETRFPEVGELCYFSYTASFPEKYPFYDRRPLVYVMEIQEDKIPVSYTHLTLPTKA